MNRPFLYKFGSILLAPIFRFFYRPKIKGIENLKVSGRKIIASNHIHLFDQCHTIISTKEFITFMAKKEYFDSSKTRWFFKSVGCIPVNRSIHDKSATNKATEILKSNGSIGIFPEGTRNAFKIDELIKINDKYNLNLDNKKLKKTFKYIKKSEFYFLEDLVNQKRIDEEDLILNYKDIDEYLKNLESDKIITHDEYLESKFLDFKFGTVSMAKKTDSYIVPVVITGKYKFRSKNLVVNYGKPFKVTNMELEDANILYRKKMKKLLDDNLK